MNSLRRQQGLVGSISPVQFKYRANEALYKTLDRAETQFPQAHSGAVNSLAVDSLEQRFLLTGGGDASLKIWDLGETVVDSVGDTKYKCLEEIPRKDGHSFGVSHVQWWPFDNGLFVSSSFDNTVKVWDANVLAEAYSFNLENKIYNFDISSLGDHSLVATAADHPYVRLLDLRTTSSSHTLVAHSGKVLSVKWSPRSAHELASAGSDGTVRLWDIRRANACVESLDMGRTSEQPSRTPMQYRKAHRASVNGLCWFPAGDFLVSSGNDEKIRVWGMRSPGDSSAGGRNMLVNFGPLVRNRFLQTLDPCLSPSSDLQTPYLFFPSDNGELFMFQAVDGKIVKRLTPPSTRTTSSSIRTACIIPRGPGHLQFLSGALDGSITVWSPNVAVEPEQKDVELLGEKKPTVLDDIWKSIHF
uniref:ARAD1D21032p n=1 Tax=Blastobotrys adeninivorans TaxID=409370 RepID=A0A060TF85_BLAAD